MGKFIYWIGLLGLFGLGGNSQPNIEYKFPLKTTNPML